MAAEVLLKCKDALALALLSTHQFGCAVQLLMLKADEQELIKVQCMATRTMHPKEDLAGHLLSQLCTTWPFLDGGCMVPQAHVPRFRFRHEDF